MDVPATVVVPGTELAARIAKKVTGRHPANVRRFTTGAPHYVFKVVTRLPDLHGKS